VVRDYSLAIGSSIAVALFIRIFLLEAYRMPSRAMIPAVEAGDTLFVSKFSYGFKLPWSDKRYNEKSPRYGDVAVLEFPDEPGRAYIKRIVGLPGDRVKLSKGVLVLNGKPATTPPDGNALCTAEALPSGRKYTVCFEPPLISTEEEITVPPGNAFVAGDLRSSPNEIRRLKTQGLVPFQSVQGRAQFVWLSIQAPSASSSGDWFSRIRFNRLFKRIR
jgi:signal peptidase I